MSKRPSVKRTRYKFKREIDRVISRLLILDSEHRYRQIIQRVLNMNDKQANKVLMEVLEDFTERHRNIGKVFERHFQMVQKYLPQKNVLTEDKRLLIGAYFTQEYSIQAAAFFNPSIIPHPDQSNLPEGSQRFILSFRSTGEGHISSVEFREGVIDKDLNIHFEPVGTFVEEPEYISTKLYHKPTFQSKLGEMQALNTITNDIFEHLPEKFTYQQLKYAIRSKLKIDELTHPLFHSTVANILWLAKANYEIRFSSELTLSERVIYPVSDVEKRGIEDARFVRFVNDDDSVNYYATYTAFNDTEIQSQILETVDFLTFKMSTLNGKAVKNKGMALFPRKINDQYAMISRQDGENLFIMYSDNVHFWHSAQLLRQPEAPWEYVQIGNCGSPIETEEGWILLTHGVGPIRQYCIGAILLDLEEPSHVIGWMPEPLLSPREDEREGYVPNVVYTCGALRHHDTLVIPYAMSDIHSRIAYVSIPDLIHCLKSVK